MTNQGNDTELTTLDEGDADMQVLKADVPALAALNRSELETQLDAAHRYPRSVNRFTLRAGGLATRTVAIAESCIYTLPRSGKPITGPSVRLAEICASTYGNLHAGARPIEVGRDWVISQGIAWDLENNYRVTIEAKRRITGNRGRFNDDMIGVTHAAATAIAFRNAIFKVIPRSFIEEVYAKVRAVAVGDAKTLDAKRAELFERLAKMGVSQDRVLAAVQREALGDVGLDDVEVLIGLGTAVKNNDKSIDEAFPAVSAQAPQAQPGDEGRRIPLASTRRRRGGETVDNHVDTSGNPPEPGTDG